jgi:hypothetical protein
MGSSTTVTLYLPAVTRARTGHTAKGYYGCVFVSLVLESQRASERACMQQQRKALLSVIATAAAVVVVEWFHLFCVFITLIVCE